MKTKTFPLGTSWLIIGLLAISALGVDSKTTSADEANSTQIGTVSSIFDNPVEGQEVTLRGKIIDQQPEETDYVFTDGTNKITIQLQENDYPYNPDTTVEISGIVDFESQHTDEVAKDPTPEDIQVNVNQLQVVTSND